MTNPLKNDSFDFQSAEFLCYNSEMEKKEPLETAQFLKEQKDALDEMCFLLSKKNDPNFIFDFFSNLFTPAELKDFASRWILVRALERGMTQREIAQKYRISLCKITRGSRELKKPNSAFKRLLDEASKSKSED